MFKGLTIFIGIVYLCAMFISPLLVANGSLSLLKKTLLQWQSFNAAIVALITAYTVFHLSEKEKQKQLLREHEAILPFMPAVLSELQVFFKECGNYLEKYYDSEIAYADINSHSTEVLKAPCLPSSYKEVFREAIRTAAPRESRQLAYYLKELQVINSRILNLSRNDEKVFSTQRIRIEQSKVVTTYEIKKYYSNIVTMQGLSNRLFDYSRRECESINFDLTEEDIKNSMHLLNVRHDFKISMGHSV